MFLNDGGPFWIEDIPFSTGRYSPRSFQKHMPVLDIECANEGVADAMECKQDNSDFLWNALNSDENGFIGGYIYEEVI